MKAIIWKELRENFKWAVMFLLTMSAAMAINIYAMSSPHNYSSMHSLLDDGIQAAMICGSASAALLLGLLQIIPELRRDRWAFLVHRPLTPTRLFFGKVTAGLMLYVMAVLVPLLAAGAWIAMPGHVTTPFEWRMFLPGIADIFAGAGYYFAAMLIGVRQARWYGSRVLPLGLVIVDSAIVFAVPEFWEALLAAVITTAIVGTAAWGSFIAFGQYRSQPRPAKAALGVCLWTGLAIVGGVGAVALELALERVRPLQEYTSYHLDKNGRVLRMTVKLFEDAVVVTDLAGKPMEEYRGKASSVLHETVFLPLSVVWSTPRITIESKYRTTARFLYPMSATGQTEWYYSVARRAIIGYDSKSRRYIGAIGPSGFGSPGSPPEEKFPEEPLLNNIWREPFLVFPSGIYMMDWDTRRVRLLQAGTREHPILGAGRLRTGPNTMPDDSTCVLAVGRVYFFPSLNGPPIVADAPAGLERYYLAEAGKLPGGGYVLWYQYPRLNLDDVAQTEPLELLSATGAVESRQDVPPVKYELPPPQMHRAFWGLVTPIGMVAVWKGVAVVASWMVGESEPHLFVGDGTSFWVLAGVLTLVGAVGWALAMCGLGWRLGFTRRQLAWWTVGGFVLGPAGVLMVLSMRDWPVRVKCAACGRPRVVDRERCEHCGAGFPPPAVTGTEIMDEGSVPGTAGAM